MVNKNPFVFTLYFVTLYVIRLTYIYIYIHVHFCIYKLFLTSGYVPWHGATILPHHIACHFVSYSIIYTLWFYKITNYKIRLIDLCLTPTLVVFQLNRGVQDQEYVILLKWKTKTKLETVPISNIKIVEKDVTNTPSLV